MSHGCPVLLDSQLLQYIKLQTDPDIICISSKADPDFMQACKAPIPDAVTTRENFTVQLERASIFSHDKVGVSYRFEACTAATAVPNSVRQTPNLR